MTAEVDVNVTVNGGGGEVSVPPKDLPNGNANADAGLVFVNGCGNGNRDRNDAVSSDPVKTDLNSGSSVDVSVAVAESEFDNSKPVVESRESVVESEIDQAEENGEEKIEIFHVEEKQESPVVVDNGPDGEVDRENEVSDSTNGEVLAENQGVSDNRNSEVDTELVVVESADNDQPQDSTVVVSDLLDGDQCTPPQIEPEPIEIAESMPSLVNDATDLPVEPARENENDTSDMTNDAADLPKIAESMPSLSNDATDLPVEPARENENDTPDMTNDAADLPEIAESMPSLINDASDLPVEPARENENDTPDMTNDAADLPEIAESMPTPDMTNDAADLPVEPARENESNDTPEMTNDAADLQVEPACENKNDTPDMTNSAEEVKVDLEESAPCGDGDVELESQVFGGPSADLGTGHSQDIIPEKVVSVNLDTRQEETPLLSDSCEIANESLPSPVVVSEDVPIETAPCVPAPVSISTEEPEPAPVSITEPEPAPFSITTEEPEPAELVSNINIEARGVTESVENIEARGVENIEARGVGEEVENIEARGVAGEVENIEARGVGEEVENGVCEEVENIEARGIAGEVENIEARGVDEEVENGVAEEVENIEARSVGEEVPEGVAEEVETATVEPKVPEGVAEEAETATAETATVEPKVPEGVAEEGENGQNNGAGSENNGAGSEIGLNNSTGSAVKVSNMEPKVPGGVGNGPLSNDLNNDEKVATSSDSSIEPEVPEGVAETEVESKKASTWKDSSMETKVSEGVNCKSVVTVGSSSRDVPVHVENGEIQFTGEDNDDKKCLQVDNIDGIHRDEAPTSTTESASDDQKTMPASSEDQNVSEHQNEAVTASTPESSLAASEVQDVETEVVKRPFYCLIKVPRFEDDNLKEQIKLCQLKVDEKTRSRDAIRDTIHTRRTTFKENGETLEAAISEEKTAREMLKSKRQEIDSLQLVINKLKNVKSVEDIDSRIRQMKHMIEHETLPLKEEKQLIREIEQLKQHREQFSSSIGKQDEIQQAFDQKDQIEERLKVLRKEADSLRENVSKAEAATQAARKKQRDESEKLRELHTQFKAADDTRQEAYKNLQSFRKQAYDKNKYFWNYKDDVKAANDLLLKGDKEALQNLCDNQVERVLEMWNNNDEFRKEYVRCNINSTVRRLKTLDGRSLGPNEVPPVIRSAVINRVARNISASQISTVKEQKPEQVVPVKAEKENKSVAKVVVQKDQAAKSERPAKPAHLENGSATVSGRNEIEEPREEEPKRTKEEEELARKTEELARKAEELRKKEEAAKLKEQHRFEEKLKAKEALERKKRIAEKAQARAVLRAQKEAEQREKEREKRARKKDKKKVAAADDASVTNEEESAPSTETPTETPALADVKYKSTTVTKKTQKISQFTKQTKSKSVVPLPLRNRSKRRMQSWMWVLIAALAVFALFLLGNSGFSFKSGLQWLGF
ncbi:hypothetical protein Dsin_003999 [Dipteronia sinensis]|uniref:Uncharacterized protein n=1 Tax=Dipteronia sinensis TaxID=43782 RepID=A0AAE0EKS1_9ROSI|nr:hypothetical protein Dsin_003999 [Dipteronia sinensis]